MLLIAGALSSCVHKVPKPPVIEFNLHDEPNKITKCALSNGTACDGTPISQTNNWLMLKPSEWQKIQGHVDHLVCIIEGGCQEQGEVISVKKAKVYIYQVKKTLYDLRHKQ